MIEITMPDYTITVTNNQLDTIKTEVRKHYQGETLFIVTDQNVYDLYYETLRTVLNDFQLKFTVVTPGEVSKDFTVYQDVIKDLLKQGIKRDHFILAVGGGVVGDLTGFIASTLFRGLAYAHIPTTLLAQVDSSVGGKVAINLAEGKNLIGAFYNPKFVLIDRHFLSTLPKRELNNGIAEMLKAGLIKDKDLYNKLKSPTEINVDLIVQAIEVKRSFVLNDPFDKNERMILNFGHTFGHAIEKVHHFESYKHGEAISYGMLMALKIGIKLGITDTLLYNEVKALLLEYQLITLPLLKMEDYIDAIHNDKKAFADGIQFILLKDVGVPLIKPLKVSDIV